MTTIGVVIPAAGAGRRLGGRAKAELSLAGRPLLEIVLQPFLAMQTVTEIVVSLPPDVLARPPLWLQQPRVRTIGGGAERIDSVRAGIEALPATVDLIVIHDAARPLISVDLIDKVVAVAKTGVGAIAALPATDTIHVIDDDRRIVQTPDRSVLWQAQTPQAFPRAVIVEAYRRAAREGWHGTDDAGLVVRCGGAVQVVHGDPENLKVTVPEDIALAEAWLARRA